MGSAARVELRPTIPADLAFVSDKPLPHRIRAITGELDGRVIGIGGLVYKTDGTVWASLVICDEARRYKLSLHKAALLLIRMARQAGHRVLYSELAENEPGAAAWHQRLGFVNCGCFWMLDLDDAPA